MKRLRSLNAAVFLLVGVLLLLISTCSAAIWPLSYTSEGIADAPAGYQLRAGQWSSQAPGDGRSFIKVIGNLSIDDEYVDQIQDKPASIDVIFVKNTEFHNIGHAVNTASALCCTQQLITQGDCNQLGSVILKENNIPTPLTYPNYKDDLYTYGNIQIHHILITNISKSQQIEIPLQFNVTDAGLYNILVISCFKVVSPDNSTNVQLKGDIIFMNPFGYLSAENFPILYSDLIISLFYVLIAVLWLFYCFRYKNTLLHIHYWIAIAIVLGFLESIIDYSTLSKWNKTGVFSTAGLVFSTLFGTAKRSFGRTLVLLVAMGYSITISTIPRKNKIRIFSLTFFYFLIRYIQTFIEGYPTPSNGAQISYIFLTIPVSVLDTVFIFWILTSFLNSMNLLKESNQNIKLQMFRNFLYILVTYAGAVIILVIIEMVIQWVSNIDVQYMTIPVFDLVWDYIYFFILLSICIIWKPSENNQKYAYSELSSDISVHSIDDIDNDLNEDDDDLKVEDMVGNVLK